MSLKAESHRRRSDGDAMNQTLQERNKALVLEAFDTLFNKREYKAAEQYWSLNYIQHSAHIEPGREGDTVTVTFFRGRKKMTARVTLGEARDQAA